MSLLHIKEEGHEDGGGGVRRGWDAVLYSVRSVVYDFARDTWRFPWRNIAMFVTIRNFFIRGPLYCRVGTRASAGLGSRASSGQCTPHSGLFDSA